MVLQIADNFNVGATGLPTVNARQISDDFNISTNAPVVPTAPSAPTGLVATGLNGGASLSWVAPLETVTSYRIRAELNNVGRIYTYTGTSPVQIGELANGVTYNIQLLAINGIGTSPAATTTVTTSSSGANLSATVLIPAPIVPSAPTLSSAFGGDSSAVITWIEPIDTGGSPLVGYTITAASTDGVSGTLTVSASVTSRSVTLVGLTNDVPYLVSVVARNGVGSSAPSNSTLVTPFSTSIVVVPPPPPPVEPSVPLIVEQPMTQAFPPDRIFHPANWLKSQDEVPIDG